MPLVKSQVTGMTREIPAEVLGKTELVISRSWKIKIRRRIEELESGKVKGIPLEKSLARARKAAGL
jgi:hypothetical protein